MSNIQVESDLKEILTRIDNKLDKLSEDVTELKVGQAEIKGDLKAIDERLSGQIKALDTKVEQLDKRVGNQEFTPVARRAETVKTALAYQSWRIGRVNCGAGMGGAAKFFGMIGNP